MNDILKQRLVGALILVALGVVFWPIIFVEPGERSAVEQVRIPLPPVIDTTPLATPDQDGLRASPEAEPEGEAVSEEYTPVATPVPADVRAATPGADRAGPEAAVVEARTRSTPPERPVLDSKGVPVAWVLQVASVSSATKAEELRTRLLDIQEKAYVQKLTQGGKVLYRVCVGPNFERAQLEKIQADVDARFGVNSIIARYIP